MIKSIAIITNKYPNRFDPHIVMFVQQFAWAIADSGVHCSVICPMAVPLNPRYLRLPDSILETTPKGNHVKVYFPKYAGFGQTDLLVWNPARLSTHFFTKSAEGVLSQLPKKPDALYGHFVTPAGIATARLGKKHAIPSFMGFGEFDLSTIEHFGGVEAAAKELKHLQGVIAVSGKNKELLVDNHVVDESMVGIFPNAYNEERFKKMDRDLSREKFGFPKDAFIVGFVGSFDERKGVLRLLEAVKRLDDVYVICAGKGSLKPVDDRCLHNTPVLHSDLPAFLSAADVFALPTQNEGCSNAIIEAVACGCPIISSDMSFNFEILDKTNAILIDPDNVDELTQAIRTLRDQPALREALAKGSLEKAKGLTLPVRAANILAFMESRGA